MSYNFPRDFKWGATTSAYQIEGTWNEDGKGESIWDRFVHTPGKIADNDTGDIACDHYHKWREDIEIMKTLNLSAYRFSISWPRIFPSGSGEINIKGLDFYDRLTDGLLEAGITPFVTLYHWDLPQKLQEKGGWAERQTVEAFSRYSRTVFERFSDRVKNWITLNESYNIAFAGNMLGDMAPGLRDSKVAIQITHNLNVAHGMAVRQLREIDDSAQIGIAHNSAVHMPADNSLESIAAAKLYNEMYVYWFLDPIFKGRYPENAWKLICDKGLKPEIKSDDFDIITERTDFLGLNYYYQKFITSQGDDYLTKTGFAERSDIKKNVLGWEIVPSGFYHTVKALNSRYCAQTIYVMENGLPQINDSLDDTERVKYLREHLIQMHKCIEDGYDIRGYFAWTLYDNFEWAEGFGPKFGIVSFDRQTGVKTIKKSGHWYSSVIKANAIV
jgi:beta-glucosidase